MKIERVGRKGRWKFEKVQQGVFKHKVGHGLYDIRNDGDIDHINKMWMNGVRKQYQYPVLVGQVTTAITDWDYRL